VAPTITKAPAQSKWSHTPDESDVLGHASEPTCSRATCSSLGGQRWTHTRHRDGTWKPSSPPFSKPFSNVRNGAVCRTSNAAGARKREASRRIGARVGGGAGSAVASVRVARHVPTKTCWSTADPRRGRRSQPRCTCPPAGLSAALSPIGSAPRERCVVQNGEQARPSRSDRTGKWEFSARFA
jgi:hypothetical protein